MASVIWAGETAVDLGWPPDVFRAAGEMAAAANAAGDGERWEHLASVPDQLEQDAGEEWLRAARAEAEAFLDEYGDGLSPETTDVLERLAGDSHPAEEAPPPATKAVGHGDASTEIEPSSLLEVPDVVQRDDYSCGAACAMSVGRYFGVGPESLDAWKGALGTTEEKSTNPDAIITYLTSLGLSVEARDGLTLDDLAVYWRRGMPVIVPCQDYMNQMSDRAEFTYGHYLVYIGGPTFGYLFFQDPSEDNVARGSGTDAAPGKVMIAAERFIGLWHDRDVSGKKYVRYGIAVGPPSSVAKTACKPGETAASTGCTPATGKPHDKPAAPSAGANGKPHDAPATPPGGAADKPSEGPKGTEADPLPASAAKPSAVRRGLAKFLLESLPKQWDAAKAVAERIGAATFAKLPGPAQRLLARTWGMAKAVDHKLESFTHHAAQALVKQAKEVAAARGLNPKQAELVSRITKVVDGVAKWTVNIPVAHHFIEAAGAATGGVAFVAAKVGYYVPVGSLAYVAWSAAVDPFSTMEAAKSLVKKALAGRAVRHSLPSGSTLDRDAVDSVCNAVKGAADGDWFLAAFGAAFDETHNLKTSLELAATVGRPGGTKAVAKSDAPDDEDMGTPEERAELLADLLYGLFGADAFDMLEDKHPKSKGWNPSLHPRGRDGRFIRLGSPEAVAAAQSAIDAAIGDPTSVHLTSVMDHANILTVKQLRALRAKHGIRAPAKLREQLVGAIKAKLEGKDEGRQGGTDGGRGDGTGSEAPGAGGSLAGEAGRPGDGADDRGRDDGGKPAGQSAARRVPAEVGEVNRRLDRFEQLFRSRGNHQAADWMGQLRQHVNAVGTDAALAALGEEVAGEGKEVQYAGWQDIGDFTESYLDRNGITLVRGHVPKGDKPAISTVTPSSDSEGTQGRGREDDVFPTLQTLRDKLDEAQHLPGLEASEDIGKLMGKEFGAGVPAFTPDVVKKLDETYGEGKWIVKSYGDEAYAGYGIFFPQRVKQIPQDAKNTLWQSGQELAKYGFSHLRDDSGKVVGIKHAGGDKYLFGTKKYDETIQGDAREWADAAQKVAADEHTTSFPEGKFMAQPAFPVVGVSNEERAAGVTFKKGQEGRVHIFTRNGKAEIIPHSTWLKEEHLPVVFESDDTRAMARAAVDAINALPESEREGQLYAPDIVKTADGYRVVEANPANEAGASGYLQDNPFVISSYVAHVTGTEPAHVKFIRKLLSDRRKGR